MESGIYDRWTHEAQILVEWEFASAKTRAYPDMNWKPILQPLIFKLPPPPLEAKKGSLDSYIMPLDVFWFFIWLWTLVFVFEVIPFYNVGHFVNALLALQYYGKFLTHRISRNFTILVKNAISFPDFGPQFQRRNVLEDANATYLQNCIYHRHSD